MKNALLIASTRAHADPRAILRLQDTASFLLSRGWSVDLLVPRSSRLMAAAMPRAVRVLTVPRIPFMNDPPRRASLRRFATGVLMFLRGVALAARRGYTFLHGVDDGAIVARAIDRGTVRRIPYVVELLDPYCSQGTRAKGIRSAVARSLERSALRHAGAIVLPGEDVLGAFDGPIPKSRVSFIPDPHAELFPDTFTRAEFDAALDKLYAYLLR